LKAFIKTIEVNPDEQILIFHFYNIPGVQKENAAGVLPDGVSSVGINIPTTFDRY
jgi:hypothetical protein